ncbi:MAG: protein phosphatase 2C domain-containing protein [Clostridia bacterium]|nr:protein phosphatase 2C domain-containing protein [Clostridia bacterium]
MKNFSADNISVQGYSHVTKGTECQDSSVSWCGKKYRAVIVCDGHGSNRHFRSAVGSKFACLAGQETINDFMTVLHGNKKLKKQFVQNEKQRDDMLRQLERAIIQKWIMSVEDDVATQPFAQDEKYLALADNEKAYADGTPVKAYGSTFVAVVLCKAFFFVLKLGDGNVCVLSKDKGMQSIETICPAMVDEQLQFNLTTSLCGSSADMDFKHCFVPVANKQVLGIVVTSDGIFNCYLAEQPYLDFASNVVEGYTTQEFAAARDELADFLPRLSQKGSGDDMSVAVIFQKQK